MKYIPTFIAVLTLIFHLQSYSQENSKGLSLKVKEVIAVQQKNGKTSWAIKTILHNHSRDTLFYFNTPNCEAAYFMAMTTVDSIQLYSDFEKCDETTQTVTVIPPKGQRIIDIVISSSKPVTSPFKFKVLLMMNKAKNRNERISRNELNDLGLMKKTKRHVLLVSKQIKI